MKIQFSKMQGVGNDFIVIDAINQTVKLSPAQIRQLADRHFGIGCDQLLLIEPARQPQVDFYYRIFNADGNEVSQCGNGARCVARFALAKSIVDRNEIRCQTNHGLLTLSVKDDLVTVNMGIPEFDPQLIPLRIETAAKSYQTLLNGETIQFGALSLGNPHAVIQVDDINQQTVASIAAALQATTLFPQGVNVGFMQVQSPNQINLRVFERGVGETLGCGSGACAAVVVGNELGLLQSRVDVALSGGPLQIEWNGQNQPVVMTGPAEFVFEGEIEI